ncbi:O-methyltransferase [Fulvivirgaceae bacterium BMA10]|uniref:O-methyltransferase n=1 Tax=Splendidivirga corallicola TaxID=3051826 RepID=A0ABT8KL38_9BACT|nr:O-methyltransferase [Fulvivirgaceae bacterium BMA10]
MEVTDKEIQQYAEQFTQGESDLLKKINRNTHAEILFPRMLSGHLQGRLLAMLSNMIRPKCVLEIGTYTGYSAICLAEGLAENGKLITIDINEELENVAKNYFKEAGLENTIDQIVGDALEIIPDLNEEFDLVFLDADKENYVNYFDLILNKVKKNGFIIADNVVWSGKVMKKPKKGDRATLGIIEFNEKVHADNRVENVLLPVRDGLMILRKL